HLYRTSLIHTHSHTNILLSSPKHLSAPRALLSLPTRRSSDLALMEPTDLRRRVTMVFQQPNPFPMSVFDNVAYVLREQGTKRPRSEEHTSESSHVESSYAVFCLKKKKSTRPTPIKHSNKASV